MTEGRPNFQFSTGVEGAGLYESKADFITRVLRQRITAGDLQMGSVLRQRDVAEEFRVSPTPVREALNRLRAEGLVDIRLHHGATVRGVTERRQENWRIRESLESLAAQMAAERVTDEDLTEIGRHADEFARAGDPVEVHECNLRFHMRVYQVASLPVLLRFIEELWRDLDVDPSSYRDPADSAREHFEILASLKARDGAKAAELTARHIASTAAAAGSSGEDASRRQGAAVDPETGGIHG